MNRSHTIQPTTHHRHGLCGACYWMVMMHLSKTVAQSRPPVSYLFSFCFTNHSASTIRNRRVCFSRCSSLLTHSQVVDLSATSCAAFTPGKEERFCFHGRPSPARVTLQGHGFMGSQSRQLQWLWYQSITGKKRDPRSLRYRWKTAGCVVQSDLNFSSLRG